MTNVVTGASVTVRNQLADGGAIESVVDDNTNELTANDIETLVVSNDATLTGTGGNDTFLGGSSAQTIDGLEGDDFMMQRLQQVSLGWMDKTEVGRLMSRLQGDVNSMQEFLETSVMSVGDIVLLFGIVAVLLYLDPWLGLLTLATMC